MSISSDRETKKKKEKQKLVLKIYIDCNRCENQIRYSYQFSRPLLKFRPPGPRSLGPQTNIVYFSIVISYVA